MSPTIEIDDDVLDALKQHAEPFVDTPNDVLRRLLLDPPSAITGGLSSQRSVQPRRDESTLTPDADAGRTAAKRSASGRKGAAQRKRARSSDLLPEVAYELPILRVLVEAGGRLPTSEAVAAVGEIVADELKPMDHDIMNGKRERWEMRVQFTRMRLVERKLLKKDSPRGIWEISDAGRELLKSEAVAA